MDDFNTRDLFAGLAMAGWLGNARLELPLNNDKAARYAYDLADAMLKEKEKRDGHIGTGITTNSSRRKPKDSV